jgi:hypothetical protein
VSEPDLAAVLLEPAALFFKSILQELLRNTQRLKTLFQFALSSNLFIQRIPRLELCSTEKTRHSNQEASLKQRIKHIDAVDKRKLCCENLVASCRAEFCATVFEGVKNQCNLFWRLLPSCRSFIIRQGQRRPSSDAVGQHSRLNRLEHASSKRQWNRRFI